MIRPSYSGWLGQEQDINPANEGKINSQWDDKAFLFRAIKPRTRVDFSDNAIPGEWVIILPDLEIYLQGVRKATNDKVYATVFT
jgi:hypothetical protein